MRVIDAGVLLEILVGRLEPASLGDQDLAVPHLIDSEVAHALRGLVRRGTLSDAEGALAMTRFAQLILTRYPADWLRERIWELRDNLPGYEATYVALAEMLDATELLTTDARLARAPGPRCRVRLLPRG